jgi:hypothetical protein
MGAFGNLGFLGLLDAAVSLSHLNRRVFFRRDGSLLLEHRLGPLQPRDDRRGQPIHINREVVNLPQKRIRGHRAGAQHGQQMFGLGLDEDAVADQVERFVLGGGFTPRLRGAGFDADDFLQHAGLCVCHFAPPALSCFLSTIPD